MIPVPKTNASSTPVSRPVRARRRQHLTGALGVVILGAIATLIIPARSTAGDPRVELPIDAVRSALVAHPIPDTTGETVFEVSMVIVGGQRYFQLSHRLEHADGTVATEVTTNLARYGGPAVLAGGPLLASDDGLEIDAALVRSSVRHTPPKTPADALLLAAAAAQPTTLALGADTCSMSAWVRDDGCAVYLLACSPYDCGDGNDACFCMVILVCPDGHTTVDFTCPDNDWDEEIGPVGDPIGGPDRWSLVDG